MKFLSIMFCLLFSFSAFAEIDPKPEILPKPKTETLMGMSYDSTGIAFQVKSGGCTRKSDFSFLIAETHPVQLTLIRNKQDNCEVHAPHGTTIKFTWEEMRQILGIRTSSVRPTVLISNKFEKWITIFY